MLIVKRLAIAGAMLAAAALPGAAQKASVADVARQLSGTWTINRALSPAFAPGRGNGGRAQTGARFAVGGAGVQGRRGGGGGDPTPSSAADLTPAELAERGAMQRLRQISSKLTIAATAETLSITDERGEQSCAVNGKGTKAQMYDVSVDVKCRWDKDKLRQEFSTTSLKLIRVWGLDESNRLVLKAKIEGVGQNSPEATAVFDRAGT
jgi:hypothetical protein